MIYFPIFFPYSISEKKQYIHSYIKWSGGLREYYDRPKGVSISFTGVTVLDSVFYGVGIFCSGFNLSEF